LGGHLASRTRLPLDLTVAQGEQLQRLSELALHVDTRGRSHVAGRVLELGRGSVELP
jgi:predicted PhzF superfamily epimerase YddE/YHI9